MDVRTLSDSDLLLGTQQVLGSRRQLTAKLLLCLGEIEARSLYLKEAYSSMYDYCVNGLSMSEGEAHRTLAGARAGRRFPDTLRMVRDGMLHLSGLELLHTHLTQDNHGALLEAACGKTKRQTEELIRARFPRPDVPSRIRPLLIGHDATGDGGDGARSDSVDGVACATANAMGCLAQPTSSESRIRGTARLRPLSATRYHVQFTASREFRDKLERVQDFMRHQNPRGELEPIFERALDLLVADLEKKRLAKTDRPRQAKPAKHGAISRAARREVFERDGEHCTYVSPSGRRCTSRAFIELDHNVARAQGGSGEAKNLRVRCGAHNRFEAKQLFGEQYVNDKIESRRQNRCNNVDSSSVGTAVAAAVAAGAVAGAVAGTAAGAVAGTAAGTAAGTVAGTAAVAGAVAATSANGSVEQVGAERMGFATGAEHLCQRRFSEEPRRTREAASQQVLHENSTERPTLGRDFDPFETNTLGADRLRRSVDDAPRTGGRPPSGSAVAATPTRAADDPRRDGRRWSGGAARRFDAGTHAKLVSGLVRMGFRERAARHAVDALSTRPVGASGAARLDALFREALAILTA